MDDKSVLGRGTLTAGSARLTTTTLKKGTTSIVAVYGGDPLFSGSDSNTVAQVVEKFTK
jgi:hypothetical protein